jgi:type 2A phosphatase activator TIP41
VTRIKNTVGLDLSEGIIVKETPLTLMKGEYDIPVERLTPANPIIKYVEVPFYDDELEDNGNMSTFVRFRNMKDCFYCLVRYYVRVDGVLVRILDTRIFHDFTTDHFLREFWHKESTYEEIQSKGFDMSSDWTMNPQQSDMIFNTLNLKLKSKEIINV